MLADGRLADAKSFCGVGEAHRLLQYDEACQMLKVEHDYPET
jgi:hypothetical protein